MKLGFFDTETGGLNPIKNALLSIGAVCEGNQFDGYIDAERSKLSVEPAAAAVNGWPHAFADKDVYPESEVIEAFLAWCTANAITHLVAHNAPFDYGFILAAATRAGVWGRHKIPRMLCTQSIAHALKNVGLLNTPSLTLNAVSKTLGVPQDRNKQHDALEDAILTETVYNLMLNITAAPTTQTTNNRQPVKLTQRRLGR